MTAPVPQDGPMPAVGEVWRSPQGANHVVRSVDYMTTMSVVAVTAQGWTRVLLADGTPPSEVKRALRIEGATLGASHEPDCQYCAACVDARWPEDAPGGTGGEVRG